MSSLAAQLGSGEVGRSGPGKAVSGRPLPAGEAASAGPAATHAPPTAHTRLLLHDQSGRKGHSPEGGPPKPARLPEKVWTCYTHTPRGNQRSHPDGEIAGPGGTGLQTDRCSHMLGDGGLASELGLGVSKHLQAHRAPGSQAIGHVPTHSSHPTPAWAVWPRLCPLHHHYGAAGGIQPGQPAQGPFLKVGTTQSTRRQPCGPTA